MRLASLASLCGNVPERLERYPRGVTTEAELERLRVEGTAPETRIWVTHYFSHLGSSWSDRSAFREALRASGFGTPGDFTEIGSDEEMEGDAYWHHWASTVYSASPEALTRIDELAREIAEAHGVRYDDWEVQRDEHGHPRTGWDAS